MSYLEFIRLAYGLLLFLTLIMTLPHARRFFASERYGGYAKSAGFSDAVQSPAGITLIFIVWLAAAVALIIGFQTIIFALINLALCYYFFVRTRWKSILRGMGAPGFMTYWLAALIFFLEYAQKFDPGHKLLEQTLLVFKIDFALIMLAAGFYKLIAGYAKNYGVEFGSANPWWGYWWRFYKKLNPHHWAFRVLNFFAFNTEILAGVLMLVPLAQFFGGLLIAATFLFILTQIRLGFLGEMVILATFLFTGETIFGNAEAAKIVDVSSPLLGLPNGILSVFLWAYLIMQPLAYGFMYYNFLGRKRLPKIIQAVMEKYTNFFGMIIWRVFTVDIVNFFANIYLQDRTTGARKKYSNWLRFWHVGESITLASLFTTLKYYPSNFDLFKERILRYAKTIPGAKESLVIFEYMSIQKDNQFRFAPAAEFIIDAERGTVEERTIIKNFSVRAVHAVSPVFEAAKPGSYAP